MRWLRLISVVATAALALADRDGVDALLDEARLRARQSDAHAAIALLERVLAIRPDHTTAHLLIANVHAFLMHAPRKGLEHYDAAISLDAAAFEPRFFRGRALVALERHSEAAESFEEAAGIQPNSTAAHLEAGDAWARALSWPRARQAFLRAASSDGLHSLPPLAKRAEAAAKLAASGDMAARESVLGSLQDAAELYPWASAPLVALASHLLAVRPAGSPWPELGGAEVLACDLVAGAKALEPYARVPLVVQQVCETHREAPPGADSGARAAAAVLRGGPCEMVAAAKSTCAGVLAPYAKTGGTDECIVRLPANTAFSLQCGVHGLLVRRGQSLVIEGHGSSLDALGQGRHFVVLGGGRLVLRDVELTGGRALLSAGGAVLLLPSAALDAVDARFRSNRALLSSGGALAALGACNLSLTRTRFDANAASWRGGALAVLGFGEAPVARAEGGLVGVTITATNYAAFGDGAHGVNGEAAGLKVAPSDALLATEGGRAAPALVAQLNDPDGFMSSLELQTVAAELLELPAVGSRVVASLLEEASRADRTSPTAFMSHVTLLYSNAADVAAAARLRDFEAHNPALPGIDSLRTVLANRSAEALGLRARRLNKLAAQVREGGDVAELSLVGFEERLHVQDAATESFLKLVSLDPANGDAWYDFATSLFFAGEMAESERVYAAGAARAPSHDGLAKEARLQSHFRQGWAEAGGSGARVFTDDDFDEYVVPKNAYVARPESRDIQAGEETFGAMPSVYVSRQPLLARDECAAIVSAAEAWATRSGGWTTARHHAVATTDVPLIDLPAALPAFNRALSQTLLPALASRYPQAVGGPTELRVLDCFVVRYQAGAQAHLPVHSDQSLLSFTIALNDPSEYVGGGVFISGLGRAIDTASAGHAVLFPGSISHGGAQVTSGTRYIIVLFIGSGLNRGSGRAAGYTLDRLALGSSESSRGKDEL